MGRLDKDSGTEGSPSGEGTESELLLMVDGDWVGGEGGGVEGD